MITKQKYVEYLVSTPINDTCTNLAEHPDGMSHDVVSDFLKRERLTASHLWELVGEQINDSADAYLIIDDSVQDKGDSRSIEMVKLQYSGAAGGLAPGIAVVNLIHSSGEDGAYYPIDFRIDAKEADGKTKNDHFQEMLLRAVGDKQIQAKTVLFDSWYGSWRNLKLIHRLGLTFYTTRKANRMVGLRADDGYIQLDAIDWTDERLKHGIIVKLKKVPFKVKLFKVVAINGDVDRVITNDPDETVITQVAQNANALRWQVEEFHRALKQLTGSAKCQCRKKRSQRNHLACCYHAWLSLKVHATLLNKPSIAFIPICSATTCETNFAALLSRLSSRLSESPISYISPIEKDRFDRFGCGFGSPRRYLAAAKAVELDRPKVLPTGGTPIQLPHSVPCYCAVYPPSTGQTLAVTKEASSEARNATTAAISSGCPIRPIGWSRRISA